MKRWQLALAILSLVMQGAIGQGTPTTVLRDSELRADKRPQAAVLRPLAAGDAVELLTLEGGWAWVAPRADPQRRGWVRAGVLAIAAPPSVASALRSGRESSTDGTLALGLRGGEGGPVWRALIVVADRHTDAAVPVLAGSAADLEAALQIASALGAEGADLRVLLGTEATAATLAANLQDMARELRPKDGLLLYLSGHGTEVWQPAGACAAALLMHGTALTGAELQQLLAPLAARGQPLLAIYDVSPEAPRGPRAAALQGSGVSARGEEGHLQARYHGRQRCGGAVPLTLLPFPGEPRRDQALFAWEAGVALADTHTGGLLTQYFRDCLLREARATTSAPDAGQVHACIVTKLAPRLRAAGIRGSARPLLAGDATLPLEPPGASGPLR